MKLATPRCTQHSDLKNRFLTQSLVSSSSCWRGTTSVAVRSLQVFWFALTILLATCPQSATAVPLTFSDIVVFTTQDVTVANSASLTLAEFNNAFGSPNGPDRNKLLGVFAIFPENITSGLPNFKVGPITVIGNRFQDPEGNKDIGLSFGQELGQQLLTAIGKTPPFTTDGDLIEQVNKVSDRLSMAVNAQRLASF